MVIASIIVSQENYQEKSNSEAMLYERAFDDTIKHEIRIYMTRDEWMDMGQDIIDFYKYDDYGRTGNFRQADIEYEDRTGVYSLKDIGIRTKGNTSRRIPENDEGVLTRAHFKLKFDMVTSEYDYENRSFLNLNELNLKSNMETDLSYIREDYAYDLFEDYGITTSKSSFTTVAFYIDGHLYDFGVYTMIEPINKAFLTKRYGSKGNDGNLYKCLWQNYGPATLSKISIKASVGIKNWLNNYRPSYDLVTNNDNVVFDDIYRFTDQLSTLKEDEFKSYMDQNFEVDKFLKTLALNVSLGMPDDYWAMGNNYYLYFNPLGKIEFYPYDYDNSLGSGWDGTHFGGYEGIATSDIFAWNDTASRFMGRNYNYPLVEKMLSIEEYRQYYIDQFDLILNDDSFTFDYFQEKASALNELYGGEFGNVVNPQSKIDLGNAKWYFETRRKSILEQLE